LIVPPLRRLAERASAEDGASAGAAEPAPMNWAYAWALILGTLPAVAAARLGAKGAMEEAMQSPRLVSGLLAATGAVGFASLAPHRQTRAAVTLPMALLIGCAQALAIAPGISRSGMTIVAGLLLGLRREEAVRFSFLLSGPAILGGLVLELREGVPAGVE